MNANPTLSTSPVPFGSPAEMQDRHAELIKEIGPDVLSAENRDRIAEFIGRAAATGKALDAKDERAAAQGLINFWVARQSAATRTAGRKGSKDSPEAIEAPRFDETLLADFDPETVQSAAASADAWLQTPFASETSLPRHVMLRLVRLRSDSSTFDSVPTVRSALFDLDTPDRVDSTIAGLNSAGVVRVRPGESPEMDRIALRFPDLMTAWPALAGWLRERVRFREHVNAWNQAGRPASQLYEGAQLHEIQTYHDRNRFERKFTDASRDRERRRNEWNRVLKWVFLGLALAILGGWIAAGINYYKAKADQQTLLQKQQLTNIRLFVRGLGELKAASYFSFPEQEIALKRWAALLDQFDPDDEQVAPLRSLNLKQLQDCASCQDVAAQLAKIDLVKVRQLRNPIIKNDQLHPTLKAMRNVSFDMVELSATRSVAVLKDGKPYNEVQPYIREFWTQYWGEMLLVEGNKVEAAMVQFHNPLLAIQDEAETPNQDIKKQIQSSVGKYAGDKGKQLILKNTDLRLNASSFAQLDAQAQKLNIPASDRSRIQGDLSQIRKEALAQPVTNKKLVSDLEKELKRLLDALHAELANPKIPPYPDLPAR
jgi:hypothetical protein